MAFSRVWDASYPTIPADSEDISLGATRIRQLKVDIEERLAADHSMDGDANDGLHNKVTLLKQAADPAAAADRGIFYTKDVGSGAIELFYRDAAGNIVELTRSGSASSKIYVNVFSYMTAAQIADVKARTATLNVVTAINNAINAVAAAGGGVVFFPEGIYLVGSAIVLKSLVYLLGEGSRITEFKLANAADCNILEIDGFAALTGSNKETIAQGTPYSFGFDKMSFNGNRTNQTVAGGVALFGKRFHIGFDVLIYDTKGIGFYSECGDAGGQFEVDDMPEGYIGQIRIYKPGAQGFVYYGPHDAIIYKVSVSQAGQDGAGFDGAIFSRKENEYNGICYITGHIHCYACSGAGIRLRTAVHANILTGESCWYEGIVIDTESPGNWTGSYYSTINTLEAYHNDQANTGSYYNIDIPGQHNMIGNTIISNNKQSAGGLRVTGNGNTIINGNVLGQSVVSNGIAINLNASYCNIVMKVLNYTNATDIGFQFDTGSMNKIDIIMYQVAIAWKHIGTSAYNHFEINHVNTGPATFLQKTGTFSETDTYNIKSYINLSEFRFSQYGGILGSITVGNTFVDVTHLCFDTPKASDIHITPTNDWGTNRMWVSNIGATTFRVNTNAAAGTDLIFSWRVHMN